MSGPVYTLAAVDGAGVPWDIATFGDRLDAAIHALNGKQASSNPSQIHYMVYDADDPERGYFTEAAL